MDEWHVGDPADWGDFVGVPDIAYMGYLDDEEEEEDNNYTHYSRSTISYVGALNYYGEKNYDEALKLINDALRDDSDSSIYLNLKALILNGLTKNDEAKEYFDKSLAIKWSKVVVENKACMIKEWVEYTLKYDWNGDLQKMAELLNEAIDDLSTLSETDEDMKSYKKLLNEVKDSL